MNETPPRAPTHELAGKRAAELAEEFASNRPVKGKYARRRDRAIQAEALDLLHEIGAPLTLVALFDRMLGGVTEQIVETEDAYPWLRLTIDYEARQGHKVTNKELVDRVVMPKRPEITSRQGALKDLGKARKKSWYKTRVESRRLELLDSNKK